MSVLTGVWYGDDRPVTRDVHAALTAVGEATSPHGGASTPRPGLLLQIHSRPYDRRAPVTPQPWHGPRALVVTWDGRLDNREDLLLRLHHDLGADTSDVALVGAAYTRWGPDCFVQLIGDWSLALWDAAGSRVVLARDYMGNRPLYYTEVPGGIAWSSHIDALSTAFPACAVLDESYVPGMLAFGVPPERTYFRGVRRLRAGHLLIATSSDVTVRRYWTFAPQRLRYRDLETYSDHLRELLTEAVRVRLRTSERVWAHLSGGFDSSSIVCLAHRLIQHRLVASPSIQTLSTVISASPESDESAFIGAVEAWCGVTSHRCEFLSAYPPFASLLERRDPFHRALSETNEALVVAAGDQVVLSGDAGDSVMMRGSSQVISPIEALHEGHPLRFLQICFTRARHRHQSFVLTVGRLLRRVYTPTRLHLEWAQKQQWAIRAKKIGVSRRDLAAVLGVTPAALARAPERPPLPDVSAFPAAKRPLAYDMYGWMDHRATTNSELRPEIWFTFPFTHRPLVEFALGVPQLAFWEPTKGRAGMRRALSDILPPTVLTRNSKGNPTAALTRTGLEWMQEAIPAALVRPLERWELVTRDYVPLAIMTRAFDDVLIRGQKPHREIEKWLQLEAWLRTFRDSQPTSASDVAAAGSLVSADAR